MTAPRKLRDIGTILGPSSAAILQHPTGEGFGLKVDKDIRRMPPERIVEEGTYLREWVDEDGDFDAFARAVEASGDIGQPIGIRTAGPPAARRFILVYGKRRWMAARRAGLADIPVRNYGDISEAEALLLQAKENDLRADFHPLERARGYYLLTQGEAALSQREIAAATGKDKSYVSVMVAVGAAVVQLNEVERLALFRSPNMTVRNFQVLAKIHPVERRLDALRALAEGRADPEAGFVHEVDEASNGTGRSNAGTRVRPAQKPVAPLPFKPLQHRDGRSFRMRWTDKDLAKQGADFVASFAEHVAYEHERLIERLAQLAEQGVLEGAVADEARARARRILQEKLGL